MFSGFDCLCAWKKPLPHLSGVWNTCYFHIFFGKWSTLRSIFFRWVGWFKPPSSHEFKIITSFHDFVRIPRVRNRFMTKCHSVHVFCHTKRPPLVGWNSFKDFTTLFFYCWIGFITHLCEFLCTQAASMKSCLHWLLWTFPLEKTQKKVTGQTEVARPCLDRKWRKTCDLAGFWGFGLGFVEAGWIKLDAKNVAAAFWALETAAKKKTPKASRKGSSFFSFWTHVF